MARTGGANPRKTMPIMGHIQELQARLVLCAIILIVAASLAYVFRDPIIHTLLSPLEGQSLIYLNPAGGFSFILLISVYVGLAVAAPVIIHQLYCFVRPVLSKKIQHYSLAVLICSLVLLVCGVTFGYIFAIPGALHFLYEFAGEYVEASLTAESYLNFVVAYTLGLGLVFQLPLLLMLIHWIKPLTPSGLLKSERWIIVLAFVAAAIITPTPDPLNQTIIALPVIIIYQLGVIAVLISIYRERRQKKRLLAAEQVLDTSQLESAEKTSTLSEMPTTPPDPYPSHTIDAAKAPLVKKQYIDGFVANPTKKPSRTLTPPARRIANTSPEERRHTYRPPLSLDGISRLS